MEAFVNYPFFYIILWSFLADLTTAVVHKSTDPGIHLPSSNEPNLRVCEDKNITVFLPDGEYAARVKLHDGMDARLGVGHHEFVLKGSKNSSCLISVYVKQNCKTLLLFFSLFALPLFHDLCTLKSVSPCTKIRIMTKTQIYSPQT